MISAMLKLDPLKLKDWQIAEAAEDHMQPFAQLAADMGLKAKELIPMGRQLGKVDFMQVLARLKNTPKGKYIDVMAITPTPLGEVLIADLSAVGYS